MNELKELAKLNGFTQKQLALSADIKYTTLLSMARTPVTHWNEIAKENIANTFDMTVADFENAMSGNFLSPFVKWVGGKRQLLPELVKRMPKDGYDKYYEPFVGGGALLLRLAPKNAVINDSNTELVNAWESIRDNLDELSELLLQHEKQDTKEYYVDLRATDRDGRITKMTNIERGARFIYMNKAGFNGLWRENKDGQNNVPYGSHKKLNLVTESFRSVSEYLNRSNVKIMNADYRKAVLDANTGDFVYFDPPYIPVNQTSSFTNYTKDNFGLVQQEQLRDTALALANQGVKVMLSNADVPLIKDLYSDLIFKIHHVKANRSINSNASKRGKVGEVIITTY
ncbi:Methyl-directed repair DNA adenine methylase [Leuconostoc pseudomesenteroides PS12]|nr:Methyl-directed repair DNA adenine methylase [Leuconostoc pseudomesenteroides PS12]